MVNFISQQTLSLAKPANVWTRKHDVDLILGTYDYGFSSYDEILSDKNLMFKDVS